MNSASDLAGQSDIENSSQQHSYEQHTADHTKQHTADHTWVGLFEVPLPTEQAIAWASLPECGAVVAFFGNARDHAPGRPQVSKLEYEAYEQHALPRLLKVADAARGKWQSVVRLALLHRTGVLEIGDSAVIVVASAPHRQEAFEAAKFCIDTLKKSVPIWKREHWSDGESWGLEAQHIEEL